MFCRRCCFGGLVPGVLFGLEPGFLLLDFAAFGVFSLAAGVVLGFAPSFFGG